MADPAVTATEPTPGQTVGPFFHGALPFPGGSELAPAAHPDAVRLHGGVYDVAGQPIPDALIELWQPGPDGLIVHQPGSLRRAGPAGAGPDLAPPFTGWGRTATDSAGRYGFTTLRPGASAADRPAFFALTVFARGLLDRLFTRAYLPDSTAEGPAGIADPLLSGLDSWRRETLFCTTESGGYRFDIHLQGPAETVFLEYRDTQR